MALISRQAVRKAPAKRKTTSTARRASSPSVVVVKAPSASAPRKSRRRSSIRSKVSSKFRTASRSTKSRLRSTLRNRLTMGSQIQEIIVGAGGAIGMNFLANYVANTLLKITDANTKLALKVAMAVGVPVLLAPKLKNKSLKGAVVTGSVVLGALAVKDFITPSLPASLQGDELTESEKALLNAYADIASAPSLHGNHGHALLGAQNLMYGDHEHALLGAQNLMFGEPEENLLGAQHAIYGDDSMSDDWSGNAHLNGEYNAF